MSESEISTNIGVRSQTLPALRVCALTVQGILLVAASFLLPAGAHLAGLPVRWILPMHWPVILVGLCYGWRSGAIVGMAAPFLSYLISGMPLPVILPSMTIELATYGLIAGFAREFLKTNGWMATAISLVVGRLAFISFAIASGAVSGSIPTYLQAAILPGLLAAVAQFALLPLVAGWWVKREGLR